MDELQEECRRCGTCCKNGGPSLHTSDIELIEKGIISLEMLITIRKGEYVHNPLLNAIVPTQLEFVKLKGRGQEWCCLNFDTLKNECNIYSNRPVACRKLKCWDTDAIQEIMEKDTLSRKNIIGVSDPMLKVIDDYEAQFPCPDFEKLRSGLDGSSENRVLELQELINEELRYRTGCVKEHNLPLALELFYLGRPLFQLVQAVGGKVVERRGRLDLTWPVRTKK